MSDETRIGRTEKFVAPPPSPPGPAPAHPERPKSAAADQGGADRDVSHKVSLGESYPCRYELKYVIPSALVPRIREYLEPYCERDSHCQSDPPEYVINTLQLDSAGLSLHYAKLWDQVNRFKLRARTYEPLGSSPVFMEVKAKFRSTVVKYRTQIPFTTWGAHLFGDEPIRGIQFTRSRDAQSFYQFIRLTKEIGARPVMLIRYARESYFGKHDRYSRVTFDRRLQYQRTRSWDDWGRNGQWHSLDKTVDQSRRQDQESPFSGVVMELKTLTDVPVWMRNMVEDLDLHRQGYCKFSNAVWAESMFRSTPWTPEYEIDYLRYL